MYQLLRYMFSSNSVLCCLVFFLVIESHAHWLVDDQGCRTPDGGVGNCIQIKQCKPMVDFLQTATKPITPNVKDELNKYICGYDGIYKVCCPSKPIVMQNADLMAEDSALPPDVTSHTNIGLLPEDCGYLGTPDKIVNGVNAKLNEFPWMALLSYQRTGGPEFQCGGTIINDRYILTAAHCISNLTYPLVGVRVGEHDISSDIDCEISNGKEVCSQLPVQNLNIEKIIIHPGYSRTSVSDDIGLLRVSKMNTNVENVRPVCLPTDEATRNIKIKYCVVTGWGFTASGKSADILQRIDLPIVNITQCRKAYKNVKNVNLSHKQICAGGKNKKDSCRGDSGGPMLVAAYLNDETRYVQQGVVSFGLRFCGTEGVPGVYTRVAFYMDWILDNMEP